MTPEYAQLSLEIGMIVGAIDQHLGYPHFIERVREQAWTLTPEFLESVRADARALGVPEGLLWLTDEQKANIPILLSLGTMLQREVDGDTVH